MAKALIIVESPSKIKTLKKFLGAEYIWESSVGHIRDLPAKGFGIDVENDFEPVYETLADKKEVIQKIKKAAKDVDMVYLAPDPDREGEAIAWHIASILPPGTKYKRMTFNSITKDALLEALKHPRAIDQALVDAQQARRLLDRIVGYKISPILTRRVQGARDGGLSAGRVQSVALKLVVDREKEIERFVPIEYWNLGALLQGKEPKSFLASLYSVDGKRIEKEPREDKEVMTIPNGTTAESVSSRLKKAKYTVSSIEKKEKKRNPVPPFITSTLQQEASRHYGFSAQRTMSIAQSLYEGVDLGNEGAEGLITYMRTDSVRVAPEAIQGVRGYIAKEFGKEYLPEQPRVFASKKTAQEAHEAIRPTNLRHNPEKIKSFLETDQYKLYILIWRRFIASQMNPAIYDTVAASIGTDQNLILRATGSVVKFPGFLAVYEEKEDRSGEQEEKKEDEENILPPLEEGQSLKLLDVKSEQAFTRPPPRFTEASLVKELEKSGIGRPSTYAAIMNKIQSRDYTVKEKGTLKPTEHVKSDEIKKKYKLPENYFLFVGNLKPHKNLSGLIHAYQHAGEALENFPLVVVGKREGFHRADKESIRLIKQFAMQQKIFFLDYVIDEDLPSLYRLATATIFPSLYEGFGSPAVEAMSAGSPLAVSRVASLPEVCGEAAVYFDPHRPEDISRVLLQLASHPGLLHTLKEEGVKRSLLFSWEKCAEEHIRVMEATCRL